MALVDGVGDSLVRAEECCMYLPSIQGERNGQNVETLMGEERKSWREKERNDGKRNGPTNQSCMCR